MRQCKVACFPVYHLLYLGMLQLEMIPAIQKSQICEIWKCSKASTAFKNWHIFEIPLHQNIPVFKDYQNVFSKQELVYSRDGCLLLCGQISTKQQFYHLSSTKTFSTKNKLQCPLCAYFSLGSNLHQFRSVKCLCFSTIQIKI